MGSPVELTEIRSRWTVRVKDGEITVSSQEIEKAVSTCPEDTWLREP